MSAHVGKLDLSEEIERNLLSLIRQQPFSTMHILLISQHYWPETVGTARRAQLLGEYFAQRGHHVEVLCGVPNHPSMAHLFHGPHTGTETRKGVFIRRVFVYQASKRATATNQSLGHHRPTEPGGEHRGHTGPLLSPEAKLLRTAAYGTWVVRGALESILTKAAWDVVVAISPLPTGLVGAAIAILRTLPLVFDVQDIWPDAAVKAGILSNPTLIRSLELLERWVYRHCAALVVLSEDFKRQLLTKTSAKTEIHCIPNAVDPSRDLGTTPSELRKRWGLDERDTLVTYAGNLGLVQDLDTLLDAAQHLAHLKDIHFLILGDGIDRARLEAEAAARHLTQVRFESHQPQNLVPAYLAASDVCYLSLRAGTYTEGTIPSKLAEYLASGRPVVNLVAGEVARTIEEAEAGLNIASGDSPALGLALYALHVDRQLRISMGLKGREYAKHHVSIDVVGALYETLLYRLVAGSSRR